MLHGMIIEYSIIDLSIQSIESSSDCCALRNHRPFPFFHSMKRPFSKMEMHFILLQTMTKNY